ncbi:Mechanosensitive channel MscK precursor [Botrimarina colliarenosi]|uniref:Mechanosensitive channel MscK n=1 Tax=Botrimarina colliarenosi TaxID=2528001 RepID=A0A5C6AD45_9BACT|nr:mechanosensitive ion channel domain-containing protein [Botrimarina colliarenosi]TWT97884.1 Mechanosensitive channel MscK precursor [Botrimarina colliarenosi]
MFRSCAAFAVVITLSWGLVAPATAEQITDTPTEPAPIEPSPIELVAGVLAPEGPPTMESVEHLARLAEQSPDLDEESRKQAAEAYRAAAANLQLVAEFAARAEAFGRDAVGVNQRVDQVKQQLEEVKAKEPEIAPDSTLADLEQALAKAELTLATRKTAQVAAEAEPQARANRRKEVRARLAAIPEKLAALATQGMPAVAGGVAAARAVELQTRRTALENEAPALESELAKYDAEDAADLVRMQSDLAAKQTAYTERRVQRLREEIKSAREAAAAESVRKARSESISAVPALRHLAERNQKLAETAQTVAKELAQVELDLKAANEAQDQLNAQFRLAQKKIDSVGLTSSVGALLRRQRATLPDVSTRRAAVATRRATIDDVQYQLIEYEDERNELGDADAVIAAIIAESLPASAASEKLLDEAARELLDRKREYLGALYKTYNSYFNTLVDLDTTDQQVISLTERYGNFIDERVLWIRSGRMLTQGFQFDATDVWLLSPAKWAEVGATLLTDLRDNPWMYGAFVCIIGFVLGRGGVLRRKLNELGDIAARANCRSVEPTLMSAAVTALISFAWPAVVALLAWRLTYASDDEVFPQAVGHGLYCVCLLWMPLELIRQICRPRGLGEAHFAWPATVTQSLRRRLRWFTLIGLPFAFLTATLFSSNATLGHDSLERCFFISGVAVLVVFLFRLLSPRGPLREYVSHHAGGWIDRLGHVWPWLAALAPASLLGLAFAGYYYTAQVLAWRLFATGCLLVSLLVLRDLLFRMLLLRRRNLSMQQSRQRAAAAAAAADTAAGGGASVAGIVASNQVSDLSSHNEQTQRLVSTSFFAASVVGLWLIWVQVLPALSMLDKYPLWSTGPGVVATAPAAGPGSGPMPTPGMPATSGAGGSEPAPSVASESNSVTLSDLGLSLLVTFITFVLFRNGPGLLEMSLLQKLPLDASVRYAITTLASYAIVMIGAILACSTIGLRWSQIQWLATALTFGLAFGLQEMFANFVAGLIILLERPIRVGDVVTVDEISGVVSRIRIRATSITNWDRKEYVVPNKEFITGRLLNWTLSDKVNRVVVNIGVAYGTDTERARELLVGVANDHQHVLKDPAAVATFEGFGDNSLNLVLRAYLGSLDYRLQVIHELHTAINNAFNAEGIEIAFPQRDLHIRSAPEVLAVALNRESAAEEPQRGAA